MAKFYTSNGVVDLDLEDEKDDEFDISKWFLDATNKINEVQNASKDYNYQFASNSYKYTGDINKILYNSKAEDYINSLKGTMMYDYMKEKYSETKEKLLETANLTNNFTNLASKYDNEDDYNNGIKSIKRAQKYGALRTYDDFTRAIDETEDEDDKEWLKAKGEDIATSSDIESQIEKLKNVPSPKYPAKHNAVDYYKNHPEEIPVGQDIRRIGTVTEKGAEDQYKEDREKEIQRNEEISRLEQLAESKKTKENLNKYYYDLDIDEKNIVKQYNDMKEGDVPTADDSYSGRAMLEQENQKIKKAAENLAKKKGYNLDEMSKWYSRGEEDDEAQLEQQRNIDRAKQYPVNTSFQSVIENPFNSIATNIKYDAAGFDKLTGNGDGYVNPTATPIKREEVIRNTVSEGIDNPVLKDLYNSGMSIADQAWSFLLSGGTLSSQAVQKFGVLNILGQEAEAQSSNDATDKGLPIEKTLLMGKASNAIEQLTELTPLDKLLDFLSSGKKGIKDTVKTILYNSAVEGVEEGLSDVGNSVVDYLVNGYNSEYNQNIKNYIKQGYTEKEANSLASGDFLNQIVQDVKLGALSGGAMNVAVGGANAALNHAGNVVAGDDIKAQNNADELISLGEMYKDDKKISKLTDKLTNEKESDKEYSSAKLGKLRSGIISAANEAAKTEYSSVVDDYVSKSELSDDEKAIAQKFLNGEKLSNDEADIINNSKNLRTVVDSAPEMSQAHSANIINALSSTDLKINKPTFNEYNKIDTKGLDIPEALQATAKAQNFSPETEKAYIEGYDGKHTIDNYTQQFLVYNNLGRTLAPFNTVNPEQYTIDNKTRLAAYKTGMNVYAQNAKFSKALTEAQQKWKSDNKGYSIGTVDKSEIKGETLSRHQKDSVKYISSFAKAGVNIKFFASKYNDEGAVSHSYNGRYIPHTNTIEIDINAGRNAQNEALKNGAMISTFAHELTHVSENAPEEYIQLRKAVMNKVGVKAWEEAKNKQYDNLKNNHSDEFKSLSDEEIDEITSSEALAEFCSDMLKKSEVIEEMVEENPTLTVKFVNLIKKVVARLRELHKRIIADTKAQNKWAAVLKQQADDLQDVVDKWEKAVKEGIKNQNARTAVKSDTEQSGNVQDDDRNIPTISEEDKNKILTSFNIEEGKLNDFVYIQRAVENTLESEGFYTDKENRSTTIRNSDSGMIIEINKKGIKETLDKNNFGKLGKNLKYLKLSTIKQLPDIIKKGKIILDNASNYKNKNSTVSYCYILGNAKVSDIPLEVKITIRKSSQKNKFYVHHIYVKNNIGTTSAGVQLKNSKTAFSSDIDNTVTQNDNNVNNSFVQNQDREHLTTEDELIEKATQSPIDFEFGDDFDLFEEEEKDIDFNAMLKDDPQAAVELMYQSIAKQSFEVINLGKDKELSELRYNTIVNKVMLNYSIENEHREELKEKIKDFIENTSAGTFTDDFKNFVLEMRQSLLYSNVLNEDRDERRKAVRDIVKGRTLIIPQSAEKEIRSGYENIRNYANRLFGYGITVALRDNARYGKSDSTIKDIISDIQEVTGEMVQTDEIDGKQAYINLENYLSEALSPQYYNPYLEGELENIDIAAVELAADVVTEYTHQLGLDSASTNKPNKDINTLNKKYKALKAQRDKLLKTVKENASFTNDLKNYKKRLNKLDADMQKLDEIEWLIESNYDDDTLTKQRQELEDRVEEDRKALFRLKSTKAIKNAFERQIKKEVQAERDKQRNIIRENRGKYAEQLNEIKDKNYNKLSEWRNARKLSDVVDGIGVLQRKMVRALRNPTANVYVPEAFNTAYIEACTAITEALNNGKVTQANIKLLNLESELRKLNDSDTEYNGEVSEQLFESLGHVLQLTKVLGQQLEELDGRPITKKTISLFEAQNIYNVLFEIYNTVQDATKQLGREDNLTNYQSGAQINEDMKGVKEFAKKAKLAGIKKYFLNGIRTARYYSGYNDNSEIMYHVNALNEGVRKANIYKMNAEKKFLELTEKRKKEYQRSLNDVIEVQYTANNGETNNVKLTRMTALQILMTWTREQSSRNLEHMERSGIQLPDADLIAKGKIEEALDKSTRVESVNISFISALEKTLTDFELDYRKIAEEYFNKYSKAAINEVSNIIKHRSIAMADYYIPMTVDSNYLINELEELKFDATIEGMGMLKATTRKAPQPLIITSLNTVLARHINDISKLYGLAVPTRNFKKALNVSFSDENSNGDIIKTGSVRDTIKDIWGSDSNKFFNSLIADLESSRTSNRSDTYKKINKTIGGLRKAMVVKTLTANISVVIKQAASYPTAGVYLSHSSLMKGLSNAPTLFKPGNYQKLINEIDEHTAQHYMRRLGMSQPELHEVLNSVISQKVPTAINPAKWIQGVDCITTALLWNATKAEINAKYKKSGKALNTDEYWTEVTNLYDKVIEDTQPMYDSLHRSESQKIDNEIFKSVFMFKTQPIQNTGIVYDSIGNALAHPKSKQARTTAVKAVSSQFISLAVFAGMTLAAAMVLNKPKRYKDDDDEITINSIMSTVLHDMLINGTGVLMPLFGNETAELIESTITQKGRYDTFNMPVIDMLNDTLSAFQNAYDEIVNDFDMAQYGVSLNGEKLFKKIKDIAIESSGLAGIPSQNVSNILNAFLSRVGINILAPEDKRNVSEYVVSYENNYLKGDKGKAKKQLDTLFNEKKASYKSKGYDDSEAYKKAFSGVRSALSKQYKGEYQKAYLRGDEKRMNEISDLLYHSGYMVYENSRSLSDVIYDWKHEDESGIEDVRKDVKNSYYKK